MRKIRAHPKQILFAIFLLVFSFPTSSQTNAASVNNVQLTLNPLQAGTSMVDVSGTTRVTSDVAIMTPWSSTGTSSKISGWSTSLPSGIGGATCLDGSGTPKITKLRFSGSTTAADPDISDDGNYGTVNIADVSDGPLAIDPNSGRGGGGGAGDISSGFSVYNLVTPAEISSVNNLSLKVFSLHLRDGTINYSVTTALPIVSIILSCQIDDSAQTQVQSLNNTPNQSTQQTQNGANSPKTGAGEIIGFSAGAIVVVALYELVRFINKRHEAKSSSAK